MTTQTINLNCWPTPPITQNQLRRMNHWDEARAKKNAIAEARWAIKAARPTPMTEALVRLNYRPGTRRLCDADGLAPTLKVFLDALVQEGVLLDDNYLYVPESSIRIWGPAKGMPGAMWADLVPWEADDAAC